MHKKWIAIAAVGLLLVSTMTAQEPHCIGERRGHGEE